MQKPLDLKIRERLASYLAGEISRREFEEWFIPATWNKAHERNPVTAHLIGDIDLRLAEFSNGDWTEDELCEQLRPLIKQPQPDQLVR